MYELLTTTVPIPQQTFNNWTTVIGAGVITLINTAISGFIGWWVTRPKRKADLFNAFMSESSEFREELRKERKLLKDELEKVTQELEIAKTEQERLQNSENLCQESLELLQKQLQKAEERIKKLSQGLNQ